MVTDITAMVVAVATIFQVFFNRNSLPKYERKIGRKSFFNSGLDTYYKKLIKLYVISYFSSMLLYFLSTYIIEKYFDQGIAGLNEYTKVYSFFLLMYGLFLLISQPLQAIKKSKCIARIVIALPLWIIRIIISFNAPKIGKEEQLYINVIRKSTAILLCVLVASLIFTHVYDITETFESAVVLSAFFSIGFIILSIMVIIDFNSLNNKASVLQSITITLKNGAIKEVDDIGFEGTFIVYHEKNNTSFTKNILNSNEVKKIEEYYNINGLIITDLSELLNGINHFYTAKPSAKNIRKKILCLEQAICRIEESQSKASWRDRESLEVVFQSYESLERLRCHFQEELQNIENARTL